MVAVCWLNDEDLGAWLVRSGWARAYPLSISPYTLAEKEAQAALRGIWRGDFLDPWDWREQHAGRTGADRPKLMIAVGAAMHDRRPPGRVGSKESFAAARRWSRWARPANGTRSGYREAASAGIRGPCPARPYPRTNRPVNAVKCGTLQMITLLHRDRCVAKSV